MKYRPMGAKYSISEPYRREIVGIARTSRSLCKQYWLDGLRYFVIKFSGFVSILMLRLYIYLRID